jgi:hypothetical protein
MMMTKHGYSDRVENDHTSSDGSMTPKREPTEAEILAEMKRRGLPIPQDE